MPAPLTSVPCPSPRTTSDRVSRPAYLRLPCLAGLVITVLAAALLLGWSVGAGPWDGVYLFRDFVSVPDPVLGANTFGGNGAPRAVPLDAVVAVLSAVLPASLVARGLLIAPLLLVGAGMSVLLARHGAGATTVGAGLAILNPYVAERLLLGQSPSLLGYAMIPWLVVAVRSRRPLPVRMVLVALAALPAAITPVGAVMAGLTVLIAGVTVSDGLDGHDAHDARVVPGVSWRQILLLLVPVGVLSLPWIIAGLAHPSAGAATAGADAFAVAADSPLGVLGSVLTLGGVWAPGAVPASRANLAIVLIQLVLVVAGSAAGVVLRRRQSGPRRRLLSLALLAYALPVAAVLLLAEPLLPVWRAAQQVPGVALLRDTHRLLGWAALAIALLVALGVGAVARTLRSATSSASPVSARVVAAPLGIVALTLGVLTVPDVPATLARQATPVAVPAEWHEVVDLLNAEPAARVLVLPWQPFRAVDWAGPVQFLDPFPRALKPEVVHARDLVVRRDSQEWLVGGEDPAFTAGLAEADAMLSAQLLRDEGISHVLIWSGTPGTVPLVSEELPVLHRGSAWTVLAVPGG